MESWIRDYLRADFTQVKVWSDADFDAEHPAGSSLNDITRFVAFSPMPYLRSGYQAEYQWDEQYRKSLEQLFSGLNIRTSYVYPIDKKVSELTADDMQMLKLGEFSFLNNVGLLILPTPTLAKSHTISVEMTINAGNTFTDSLEMSWP